MKHAAVVLVLNAELVLEVLLEDEVLEEDVLARLGMQAVMPVPESRLARRTIGVDGDASNGDPLAAGDVYRGISVEDAHVAQPAVSHVVATVVSIVARFLIMLAVRIWRILVNGLLSPDFVVLGRSDDRELL